MQSDFLKACREARAAIHVPPAPVAAIRAGILRAGNTSGFPLGRLLIAGFAIALVAIAAATWKQTHVWVGDGHVLVTSEHPQMIHDPTARALADAARAADFPVTLPTALPPGSVPVALFKGGTSALMIQYRLPGARPSGNLAWVVLANPKSFDLKHANALPQGDLQHASSLQVGTHIVAIYRAGGEIVVVPKGAFTTRELNVMEQAMGEGKGRYLAANGAFVQNPAPEDLERLARAMPFRAIVPNEPPPGAQTIFAGNMIPYGFLLIQYSLPGASRATDHIATIVIASKAKEAATKRTVLSMMPHRTIREEFAVGDEVVIVPSSSFTDAEIAGLRSQIEAGNRTKR